MVWLVRFQPQALSIYFYMLFFVYLEKLIQQCYAYIRLFVPF
nr:MAG TPA: hypothetical protein [Bacteriophage sp.]